MEPDPREQPRITRKPTPNELRYMRSFIIDHSAILVIAVALLGTALGLLDALSVWGYFTDRGMGAGIFIVMLVFNLVMFAVLRMLIRRIGFPRPVLEVERLSGPFATDRWDLGDASFDVHSIAGATVFVPPHWLERLREGEELEAEVCFAPMPALERIAYGRRAGILLRVGERLSVDREVPLGLASLKNFTAVILGLFAMGGLGLSIFGSAVASDDLPRLMRHWRGRDGTLVFDSVCALAQAPPPQHAHVEIARANLVAGPVGHEFGEHHLIDADSADLAAAQTFVSKLRAREDYVRGSWHVTPGQFELGRDAWDKVLARHQGCDLRVQGARYWPAYDLDAQVILLESSLQSPSRYKGNFSSYASDEQVRLELFLSDEPEPLPPLASVYVLAGGIFSLLVGCIGLIVRGRRRKRILHQLRSDTAG